MAIQRPAETRRELLGYADRPSVAPGEAIDFMVSSEFATYDAAIVRLIQADESPEGPGYKEEEIETAVTGQYDGARQETHVGSHIEVRDPAALDRVGAFTVQAWIRATIPALGRPQGIVARWVEGTGGFALVLDEDGRLELRVGAGDRIETVKAEVPLRESVWYFVAAGYDGAGGTATVAAHGEPAWPLPDADIVATATFDPPPAPDAAGNLLIGAITQAPTPMGRLATSGHFNGRIESPRIFSRVLGDDELAALRTGADPAEVGDGSIAGAWDFTQDHASARVTDSSPNGLTGVAVNYPTKALTGHTWDRESFSHVERPDQFPAIEFHDDDNEDSSWDVAFSFEVPDDLASGVYAARLRAGDTEDHIPFFVRPPRGTTTAEIGYLMPTLTYQAYANESVLKTAGEADWSAITENEIDPDLYDVYAWDHPEVFYSIYDYHADGTGINYSSWHRPILNFRPKHRYWVFDAPRHFAADLYVVDWLEAKGYRHDVITDHDLHEDGVDLLAGYKVVITGSHPEYWTEQMLDGLEGYLAQGGRLMYLGGNGFYWVTAIDPERPHLIEVRRGYASSRTWTSHPAETHLASTGERGGIWRFRGRSPNALVGNGFAAQGWDRQAPGYDRLPDSNDPRAAFIFEGIEDQRLGEFGLVMGGAAGDELDRFDHGLGTPQHTLRLATSEGKHSDFYLVVHEDLLVTINQIHGTDNPFVRSDIVYFEGPNDGAVFSVGSISFNGSLAHNGYDNNISRMTENVLRRFLS